MESTQPSSISPNLTETTAQQQTSSSYRKLLMIVVISVLLTAVAAGSIVYFWQKSANEKAISSLEQKISSLEKQISMRKKEEIIPQPTSTPVNDSTSDWQTYTNEVHNFEIKYPSQANIAEFQDGVAFGYGDPRGDTWRDAFSISVRVINSDLETYLEDEPCEKPEIDAEWPTKLYEGCLKIFDANRKNMIVDSIPAIRSRYNLYEHPTGIILIEKSSKVYAIRFYVEGDYEEYEVEATPGRKIQDQILSTFRFTN